MRAVIYARASTTDQADSVNQQIEQCTAFAARQGHTIVGVYADDGVSGTSEDRIQFQALITACETTRDFGLVIVYDISRWGRFLNAIDSMYWRRRVERAGKRFSTVIDKEIDGIAGQIMQLVDAHGASEESRKRSTTVRRGMAAGFAKTGRWPGKAPYGYRKDEYTGALVKGPENELEAIRIIFENRSKCTLLEIAALLEEQGHKPPKAKRWNLKTLSNIVHNPVYKGSARWTDRGGKYEAELGAIEIEVPAIVDERSLDETLIPA